MDRVDHVVVNLKFARVPFPSLSKLKFWTFGPMDNHVGRMIEMEIWEKLIQSSTDKILHWELRHQVEFYHCAGEHHQLCKKYDRICKGSTN